MSITTRPVLVFEPQTFATTYDAGEATEPVLQGWTALGPDHATIDAGDLLLDDVGTDQSYYTKEPAAHATTAGLMLVADVQVESTATLMFVGLYSDTFDKKVELYLRGSATGQIVDKTSGVTFTTDLSTAEVEVKVLLTVGGYRIWINGVALGGSAATAHSSSYSGVFFGKITTGTDNSWARFRRIRASVVDTFVLGYPAQGWQTNARTVDKVVTVAQSGTIETAYRRADQNISFRSIVHSDANIATLASLYATYVGPGYRFWLAQDYTTLATGWWPVKDVGKQLKPTKSAAVPTHWDLTWALRVVTDAASEAAAAAEEANLITFTTADTTPDISAGNVFLTNTNGTITGFDGGVDGKTITVIAADTGTTIDASLTATGDAAVCAVGDTFVFIYQGGTWHHCGGNKELYQS